MYFVCVRVCVRACARVCACVRKCSSVGIHHFGFQVGFGLEPFGFGLEPFGFGLSPGCVSLTSKNDTSVHQKSSSFAPMNHKRSEGGIAFTKCTEETGEENARERWDLDTTTRTVTNYKNHANTLQKSCEHTNFVGKGVVYMWYQTERNE